MSKRIKTTILFFILLIISVIGNTLYTSSNLSESFFIHSEHTSDCQLQAPLPMAEKTLRHLSDHSQTDLPAAAVLTHVEKKQDTKSALYTGTLHLYAGKNPDLATFRLTGKYRNSLFFRCRKKSDSSYSHLILYKQSILNLQICFLHF